MAKVYLQLVTKNHAFDGERIAGTGRCSLFPKKAQYLSR